jgi:hypothetical protein
MDADEISALVDVESIYGDGDDASSADGSEDEGAHHMAREDIKLMNVVRAIVILTLLTVAFISAESVYVIATIAGENNFKNAYLDASEKLMDGFHTRLDNTLWATHALMTDLSLSIPQSNRTVWPFVTYTDFDKRCEGILRLSTASSISFAPRVLSMDRPGWETFAIALSTLNENTRVMKVLSHSMEYMKTDRDVKDGIYRCINGTAMDDDYTQDAFPVAQLSPKRTSFGKGHLNSVMFNKLSNPVRGNTIQMAMDQQGTVMSDFLYHDTNHSDVAYYSEPYSVMTYPIFDESLDIINSNDLVGVVDMELRWGSLLGDLLEDYNAPLVVVVESSCGTNHSFKVEGVNVTYMGIGDLHYDEIDGYKRMHSDYDDYASLFVDHGIDPAKATLARACHFRLIVFPTNLFKKAFFKNNPQVYRGIVLAVFIMTVGVFVVYDCLIEKRQTKVVNAAERSDAIVRSLFPSNVRDRLYENAKRHEAEQKKANKDDWKNNNTNNDDGLKGSFVESPKNRLRNIMSQNPGDNPATDPHHSSGMEPIADLFPQTTVMFADLAGFTAWSSEREPSQVFTLLETIYRAMDKAAKKMGVFKVSGIVAYSSFGGFL